MPAPTGPAVAVAVPGGAAASAPVAVAVAAQAGPSAGGAIAVQAVAVPVMVAPLAGGVQRFASRDPSLIGPRGTWLVGQQAGFPGVSSSRTLVELC